MQVQFSKKLVRQRRSRKGQGSVVDRTFMKHRVSRMQAEILNLLRESGGVMKISHLSFKVAKLLAGNRLLIAAEAGKDVSDPEARALTRPLASRHHRQDVLIRNVHSASFSRSLRNLEEKGLIRLQRGGLVYRKGELYRKNTSRVTEIALVRLPKHVHYWTSLPKRSMTITREWLNKKVTVHLSGKPEPSSFAPR